MHVPDRAFQTAAGLACAALVATLAACSSKGNPANGTGGGGMGGGSSTSEGIGGSLFGSTTGSDTGSSGSGIPANFVNADVGAYALGNPIAGDGASNTGVSSNDGCDIIVGVVRDFKGVNEPGGHPDFEHFSGSMPTTGLVAEMLGSDDKPVYASQCETSDVTAACPYGQQTTTKDNYDEWYRYTPDVNKPYLVYLKFTEDPSTKVSTFKSSLFFPLDGAGWGNSGTASDNKKHNFGFTTELHMKFRYNGGENFTFTGDDDLWVFINKHLAIDLGGLHPQASGSIDLDASADKLGITPGNVYPIELFHAERHTSASNFRVDTNLGFVDCGVILPDPPH